MLAAVLLQKRFVSFENLKKRFNKSGKNAFCRTCLSTEDLQPLFRHGYRPDEMSYKLKLVTDLKIHKQDELSQKICKKCLRAVDFALEFRFKSKQAEETLRRMLHETRSEETSQVLDSANIYPYHETKTSKDDTNPDSTKISHQILENFPFDVKIENCLGVDAHKQNDQNDDPFDNNDMDSDEDMKPLKELKIELKTEPVSVTEPIITIKKISKSNDNDGTEVKYSAELKTPLESTVKKRKKQDRTNKVSTFIKVDNLPADWYGFIKPNVKVKKKKFAKIPKVTEKVEIKDQTTKEDVPILIKVENLPEDMDKLPMDKVPRPHRRIPVPEGPPYKCTECDKQYTKRPMYLAHVRFHTHYHICEQCGKRCKNPSLLQTHQRAVHGLTRVHKCAQCEYSATTKCALVVHERRHKDERPFVCDHCGAAFYTRRTLAQHIGVHMPANIQCPHCPKKCKSMKLLSNHRARKHARRYIYHCPTCPKQFNDNNAVHKHLSGYHGTPREHHPTIQKQLVA